MEKKHRSFIQHEKKTNILPPNIVNVASISDDEIRILEQRTANFGGLIRIFMHPFYENYEKVQCLKDHIENGLYPKIDVIKTGMARILSRPSNKTPPIFIFEELVKLDQTAGKIAEMNKESENNVYFVPTQRDSSQPKFTDDSIYDDGSKDNWKELIGIFKYIKVRKILIGGMRLTITYLRQQDPLSESLEEKLDFSRCVGFAINELSDFFEIEISNLTHPHSRIDFLNITKNGLQTNYITPARVLLAVLESGLSDTSLKRNPFKKEQKRQ